MSLWLKIHYHKDKLHQPRPTSPVERHTTEDFDGDSISVAAKVPQRFLFVNDNDTVFSVQDATLCKSGRNRCTAHHRLHARTSSRSNTSSKTLLQGLM